jgi:hypothetical protein
MSHKIRETSEERKLQSRTETKLEMPLPGVKALTV